MREFVLCGGLVAMVKGFCGGCFDAGRSQVGCVELVEMRDLGVGILESQLRA